MDGAQFGHCGFVPHTPTELAFARAEENDDLHRRVSAMLDKACTDKTCMQLPDGKTCGDCRHEKRCVAIFGHKPSDTYCDWFPRRFVEKPVAVEEVR